MELKEPSGKKNFFNLPIEDKIDFTIEEKDKAEKEKAVDKVFREIAKKYDTDK